jgi:hypothetical protein
MGKRVLGMDPETGIMRYMDYDELTDTFTVCEVADVTALLENNQRLYNDAPARWGEGAVYASLHPVMREKLKYQGIIRTHTDGDPEPYRRWCNDVDNRKWRTRPGKV